MKKKRGLVGGLANFLIRPAARVVQNVVRNVWDTIRRRDSKYEARRVLEIDNFDNDDLNDDSDSSDDENIDYSLGFGDTTRRHCDTKVFESNS